MPTPQKQPSNKQALRAPVFSILPFGIVRDSVEILASSVPGAAILFIFMVAVGIPTVYTNSNWFAAPYIPVTCLLPIVVGMISPLALEWVRAAAAVSLRRGVACSLLSGLFGSMLSVTVIFTVSVVNGTYNPFGPAVGGLVSQAVVSVMIICLATALSAVGGAVLMLFIKKAPAEGG